MNVEKITSIVEQIAEAFDHLTAIVEDGVDVEATPQELGALYYTLSAQAGALRTVAAAVARVLVERNADQRIILANGKVLEPRWTWSRSDWDTPGIVSEVRASLIRQFAMSADGEIMEGRARLVSEVLAEASKVWGMTGSSAKLPGLRAHGLDPDDYSRLAKRADVRVI